VLFWVGVALAPLAALMLVISSGTGGLKTALGVVIISVILIGVSITLRRDPDGLRGELEDTVFDEIDALRADVRADIAHAAQATHRAFGEKMQYLLDQIETTRAELEATRVQVDALRNGFTPAAPAQRQPAPAAGMHQATGRAGIPPGVVRHTETVQVTTRHTVMDPHDDGQRGTTYGSPSVSRVGAVQQPQAREESWAPPEQRPREDPWSEPPRVREESWTEQRLREQFDRRREESEERWKPRESSHERDAHEDEQRRPGLRAGDRWASVRSDDRGRELRMGERRAALHSDSSGTELRIEDRWAAVRREAGITSGASWRFDDDQRLDTPRGDFPYRDHDERRDFDSRRDLDDRRDFDSRRDLDDRRDFDSRRDLDDRRAITSSDREERWSDYQHDRERERDRRYR